MTMVDKDFTDDFTTDTERCSRAFGAGIIRMLPVRVGFSVCTAQGYGTIRDRAFGKPEGRL